jgi:plastocyanin
MTQDAPQATIAIQDYAFQPQERVVEPGTTITWTNLDPTAHSVTFDDGSVSSGLFSRDRQFAWTFDAPGVYGYYCIPHGQPGVGMFGTIVVGEAAGEPVEEAAE